MSTGYLRWGGWAAVSTATAPVVPLPGHEPATAGPNTHADDTAGQMLCGQTGDGRCAPGQAGVQPLPADAVRTEQAG